MVREMGAWADPGPDFEVRWAALRAGAMEPTRHHDGDAGWDLYVLGDHDLPPGALVELPSGVAIAPSPGYWFSIEHRSSTRRRGIEVIQGTIDNGYRGELLTAVINHTDHPIRIEHGERLAQLIPHRVLSGDWVMVSHKILIEENGSSRGTGGFGSTGKT